MMIKRIIAGLAGIVLCSMSIGVNAKTYIDPSAQKSWLGRGVDSGTGLLKSNCLNGTQVVHQNRAASVSYSNGRTASQSMNEMAGKVGASVNLGLFGGGASVSVHTRTEETTNTATLVYRFSYQGDDHTFEQPSLNSTGQSVAGGSNSSIAGTCGDSYVNHVQMGNEIYFVSQLSFADKEDYRKFVTEIRIRILFWSRTATISDSFYDYAKNGAFSIRVVSPNPLPMAIQNILGPDGEHHCGPDSTTSRSWMSSCQSKSNDVMDYLLIEGTNPNVNYNAWLADENNLGVVYYNTIAYKDSGFDEFDNVEPSGYSNWHALSQQLLDALTEQYRLRTLIGAYADATRFDSTDYHTRFNNINSNISRLELAMTRCKSYTSDSDCQNEVNNALAAVVAVTF